MKTTLILGLLCVLISGCINDQCIESRTSLGKIKDFEIYHAGFAEITCKVITENNSFYIKDGSECDKIDYNKHLYLVKSEDCVRGINPNNHEWYEIDL